MPTTCDYCLDDLDDHAPWKRREHIQLAECLAAISAEKTKMPASWKRYGA